MEKKEIRVKCGGCGTSYKLKVPVSDQPVNFQCKKCGKTMKLKVKGDPEPESQAPQQEPAFETNEMPDFGSTEMPAPAGPPKKAAPAAPKEPVKAPAPAAGPEADLSEFEAPEFEMPEFESGFHPVGPPEPQRSAAPPIDSDRYDSTGMSEFESTRLPELEEPSKAEEDVGRVPGFETTQLPETGAYQETRGPAPEPSSSDAGYDTISGPKDGKIRKWLLLDEDLVKGPFSDDEITQMIRDGEVNTDSSLRMGERPWIRAGDIAQFRKAFFPDQKIGAGLASLTLLDEDELGDQPAERTRPFYTELPSLLPYPLAGGKPIALGIFAGIAFLLSSVLSFDFLVGIVINLIGWVVLYGYLAELMRTSMKSPRTPPPPWDFKRLKESLVAGGLILTVLMVYSMIPTVILLIAMIVFFNADSHLLGWGFLVLTVIVYLGSLVLVPGALVILGSTWRLGAALNPMKVLAIAKRDIKAYQMLVAVSLAAGVACLIIVLVAVVATDIPVAGFIVAGLLMALVLSYAHFIWFHVLGRFALESKRPAPQMG